MDVSSLVTVVVTTSPVRSNPSTDLIQQVFESFHFVPGLGNCPKVIVFDGYAIHLHKSEKRGRISLEMESRYMDYVAAVQRLVDGNPKFCNTRCLIVKERLGFGHAVKAALSEVKTKYIFVLQHDFAFCDVVNFSALVQVLEAYNFVKYIGMVSASTEKYAEARSHGPHQNIPLETEYFNNEPFVKLMFWYDKGHIARSDYYRNVVFGKNCCIRRGDFIEDRFGHWELKKLYEEGMSAHIRFGTYLWYPNNGEKRCIQHLQGRKFLLEEDKVARFPAREPHTEVLEKQAKRLEEAQ